MTNNNVTNNNTRSMTSIQAAIAFSLGGLLGHHWTRCVINGFERSPQLRRIAAIDKLARRSPVIYGDKPVYAPEMDGHKVVYSDDRVTYTIWPEGKVEFEICTTSGEARRNRVETQLEMLAESDGYKQYLRSTLDMAVVSKGDDRHVLLGLQVKPSGGIRATREPDHHGCRATDIELANAMVLSIQAARR